MSIATEITRLQNAKASIKTSLENKGATIPYSTKLDGYSTIIDAMPSASKYGASLNSFFGGIDQNGVMQEITNLPLELVFNGVKEINSNRTIVVPQSFTTRGNTSSFLQTVKSASFPDLEVIRSDAFSFTFKETLIESVSFPKLKYITNANSYNARIFNSTFNNNYYWDNGTYKGSLKTVSFPELEEIGADSGSYRLESAFNGCFSGNPELTSVSFPKLKKIKNVAIESAFGSGIMNAQITEVEMPLLEEISGFNTYFRFYKSSNIITANFPSLKKAGYNAFGSAANNGAFFSCPNLTTASFPVLDTINEQRVFYYTFQNCTSLTSVSFGGLKSSSFGSASNQFNNMLSGVTGCTVHFPSNLQSVIGSWSDVTNGFGGTNTTVLFDLPATE